MTTITSLANEQVYYQNILLMGRIGQNGVVAAQHKVEGDGKTPAGVHEVLYGFYREDRISKPLSQILLYPTTPKMGWCDDPKHPCYNQPVTLPFEAGHEVLYRDDHLYDIVLVTDYNMNPPIVGKGSAIFIHLFDAEDTKGEQQSKGCLKLLKSDLDMILKTCGPKLFWHQYLE